MFLPIVALDLVSTSFLNFKFLPGERIGFFSKCPR